jgi:hypothetical protein
MHGEFSFNRIVLMNSQVESSILEAVNTKLINIFSAFSLPRSVALFPEEDTEKRSIFPLLSRITIGDIELEVHKGLGVTPSRASILLFTIMRLAVYWGHGHQF